MKIKFLSSALLVLFSAVAVCYGQKTKTFQVGKVSFTMVYVEGGDTVIGRTSDQDSRFTSFSTMYSGGTLWNDPVQVTLDDYWIGQTEVTQELWEAVMGENPSTSKDNPKQPVTDISWDDCMVFVTRLSGLTGERFRMPTEAEWEYAARGGVKSQYYRFSGSNDNQEVGWDVPTYAVATKKPNELGIYDMTGCVREWCKDGCIQKDILHGGDNPQGRNRTGYNVFRGGMIVGVAERNAGKPDLKLYNIGFRLAKAVKKTVIIEE